MHHIVEAIAVFLVGVVSQVIAEPLAIEVASVGVTEQAARAEKRDVKIGRFPFRVNGKAIASGDTEGFVKTVFDAKTGALLGALYASGFQDCAHGPVVQDVVREGGEAAALRALAWLVDRDPSTLEPHVHGAVPTAAFNLTTLSTLVGTPWRPDLSGHVLMLEEVSEHLYRIDRLFFHVTSDSGLRRVAGLRLGACTDIPPNDPPFGRDEVQIARDWCDRAGIPYLGRALIGHHVDNRIVPFGRGETGLVP